MKQKKETKIKKVSLTSFQPYAYFHKSDSNKVLICKCSFSVHFQLVSTPCFIELFLSYAFFFPFVKLKTLISL